MEVPEWIATMVGRLVLENEALRRALAEAEAPPQPPLADDPVSS
jgi:hypothetical protein